MTNARVRATSYITRPSPLGPELLVFTYPSVPDAGVHLPGGGIETGERPDTAAIREAIEETGIDGHLDLRGVVGVQQGTYDTGLPCISVYFHLVTDEPRDAWSHTMIGDDDAWDTGLEVDCRFVTLADAAELLETGWHQQAEFIRLLCSNDRCNPGETDIDSPEHEPVASPAPPPGQATEDAAASPGSIAAGTAPPKPRLAVPPT